MVATESLLSSEHLDLADTALDVVDAWSQAIIDINAQLALEQGINSTGPVDKHSVGTMSDSEPLDCPEDTVLRTLMDQDRMDSLKDEIATTLEVEISKIISAGGVDVDSTSVSVSRGGFTLGFDISEGGRPIPTGTERPFLEREENLNENSPTGPGMPPLHLDRLVFSVRGIDMEGSGRAILTLEPGASGIPGIRGDDFFDGREVTDPCALDVLALGDDHQGGEFLFRDGGGLADPDQTFATGGGSGGGGGGASGGSTSPMCLYDWYSNDVYQFSFRAPCGDG